ncbi:PqqD family protein [Phytoactinopolyspora alkaliphila]|uniref:PqqD family protein n=1 Tax=Phytoactinopolyspora alkaliphila TaxID=1783498 RepID=A0A6N9YJI0_9ACTN|nr:PqqD family protein [Phytoactinopolyspora alkaliphila]NED95107.1 PqqD family protein [Phytoactinopolyspora alkaliphila]
MSSDVPQRAVSVREMEIDGDVTLFHAETQEALVLNATASDVWRLLDGERSVDEIVKALAPAYAADAVVVRAGVESALAQLEEHRALEWAG